MASTPLFSSYKAGENRVTGSMLAVFERLAPTVLERLLADATGDDVPLVRFRNQIADRAGSVPDAAIEASFRLLFEVKVVPDSPGSGLREQVTEHLRGLEGRERDLRLLVVTPDPERPKGLDGIEDARLRWVSFLALDLAVRDVLANEDDPVGEQVAFLLRELRRLFAVEGLLDSKDTVIVAARNAYPLYGQVAAYVCQPTRAFRKGLTHMGFYADREIKPVVPALERPPRTVNFSPQAVAELRAEGDERLARLVEDVLVAEPSRAGAEWMVFLLTEPSAAETIRLSHPIRNTTTTAEGRPWAWTLGQRYTSLGALRSGAATTSELDAAEESGGSAGRELRMASPRTTYPEQSDEERAP